MDFDYIVVGAGTAGCALVGALCQALPSASIALIESGGDAISQPEVATPGRWPSLLTTSVDRDYLTNPQAGLARRQISYPRGNGLGGSNLTNVMMYARGFRSDWDRMPAGWKSAEVEPLFNALESQLHLTTVTAGKFGKAAAAAAAQTGLQHATQCHWSEGGIATSFLATIDKRTGKRLDLYRALGADAANVTRIVGNAVSVVVDGHARGVLLSDGSTVQAKAGGEVVLCCGAVDSPKLLQLSGIGPSDLLRKYHIPEVQVLPVGEGLQDHTLLAFPCISKPSPPMAEELSPNSVQGWVHDEEVGVQIVLIDGQAAADIIPFGLLAPFRRSGCISTALFQASSCAAGLLKFALSRSKCLRRQTRRVVALNVCLVRPTSVGRVAIRSADPKVKPEIHPNLLSTPEDQKAMEAGVARVRAMLKAAPLQEMIGADLSLGAGLDRQYTSFMTSSYYHPTGSCRMGTCVDSELRVLGIQGLRVADCSVLPVHPRCGPMPAAMVVGRRCAQLLQQSRSAAHGVQK